MSLKYDVTPDIFEKMDPFGLDDKIQSEVIAFTVTRKFCSLLTRMQLCVQNGWWKQLVLEWS